MTGYLTVFDTTLNIFGGIVEWWKGNYFSGLSNVAQFFLCVYGLFYCGIYISPDNHGLALYFIKYSRLIFGLVWIIRVPLPLCCPPPNGATRQKVFTLPSTIRTQRYPPFLCCFWKGLKILYLQQWWRGSRRLCLIPVGALIWFDIYIFFSVQ